MHQKGIGVVALHQRRNLGQFLDEKQISDFRKQISYFRGADFRFQISRNLLANFRVQRKQILPFGKFQISRKFASRFLQNHSTPKSALTFQISDFEDSISQPQEFEGHILDFGKADFKFQISRKFASRFLQNHSTPKSALTFQISDFEDSIFPTSRIRRAYFGFRKSRC